MPEVLGFMSDGYSSKVGYTSDISLSRREKLEDAGIKLNVESYSRFTIEYKGKEYNINLKRPWVLAQIGFGDIVSWEELRNMGEFFYELQKDGDIVFTTVDFCKYLYPVLCDEAKDKMTNAELNRIILMLRYRLQYQYILLKYADPYLVHKDRMMTCSIPIVHEMDYPQNKEIEFLIKMLNLVTDNTITLKDWFARVEDKFPWISNLTETEISAFEFKMIRDMRATAYPLATTQMFIRLDRDDIIIIKPKSLGVREVITNEHKYDIDNLIGLAGNISVSVWLSEVKKCMNRTRVCQKIKLC